MKHIRFLSDNKTVCEIPKRLGYDFVTMDTAADRDEMSCKVCESLLLTHNTREYRKEQFATIVQSSPPRLENDFSGAKGLLYGVIFSSVFWITIVLIVWGVWLRG